MSRPPRWTTWKRVVGDHPSPAIVSPRGRCGVTFSRAPVAPSRHIDAPAGPAMLMLWPYLLPPWATPRHDPCVPPWLTRPAVLGRPRAGAVRRLPRPGDHPARPAGAGGGSPEPGQLARPH